VELQLNCPSQQRLTKALLGIVAFLVAVSTSGQVSKYVLGHGNVLGLVSLFNLDSETSVATWYSSLALLLASALLALVASTKQNEHDPYFLHWAILAGLFLMLSIDEAVALHEYAIDCLRNHLRLGEVPVYTWIIPAALFAATAGLACLRFLLSLDARTRWGMIAAALIFVSGAIGVEMISGFHARAYGVNNLGYALIVTAEELLEMLGVVVLIHTIIGVLQRNVAAVQVLFSRAGIA
jgi:hypothetical protein